MRRTTLFLSRFTIGLLVMLLIGFVSLLMFNAPSVPSKTPFASVSISTYSSSINSSSIVYLPNQIFTCTETKEQFQCQTKIQARLLDLSLTKGSDYQYDFTNCRALYDGQSVGCREVGQTYAPVASELYEITALGLSSQQLQALKQEYWGINMLMPLSEHDLISICTGMSLVTGMIAAFLVWFHPGNFSKGFTSIAGGFACGIVTAALATFLFFLMLLELGYID
jgi:hypothetical protein